MDGDRRSLISLFNTKEIAAYQLHSENAKLSPEKEGQETAEFGEVLTDTKAVHAVDWTTKKSDGQYLGRLLREAKSGVYGEEVARCATQLWLEVGQTEDGEKWRARPFSTCKRRWCPVCEWRKSRERLLYALHNWPVLIPDEFQVMIRFLTLTMRNCRPDEIGDAVTQMLGGFRRLTHHKTRITGDWLGYLRTLELTVNSETGDLHPHIHVVFLTPAGSRRHETREWVQAWRQALQVDYDPVCDIRAVRDPARGLAEVLKYSTKPAKLAHDSVTLAHAMAALKGRKLQLAGGCLKQIFAPVDMPDVEWQGRGSFWWRAAEGVYRRWDG